MSEHLALCRRVDVLGWVALAKQQGDWAATSATMQSLEPMLEASLTKLAQHPHADFTFSTANATALVGNVVEKQPTVDELRNMLPGRSITILAPIAAPGHADFWVNVWRDPRGNVSHSGRFVPRILIEQMRDWIAFFTAPKIDKGLAAELDLWVRRDWSAAAFFDKAEFPPPRPTPSKSPEQQSKAERDATVRRIVKQHRSLRESQGMRYSEKRRAWVPPSE